MSKAVSSNPFIESVSIEFSRAIYVMIAKYRPLLMENAVDFQDLEQEVIVKILGHLSTQSNWWDQIENKRVNLAIKIRNKLLALKTHKFLKCLNYRKDENKALINNLFDDGIWAQDLSKEMDPQQEDEILGEIIRKFSPHDQQIFRLTFLKNLTPDEIARDLGMDYTEARLDCLRVCNNFRKELRKKFQSLK